MKKNGPVANPTCKIGAIDLRDLLMQRDDFQDELRRANEKLDIFDRMSELGLRSYCAQKSKSFCSTLDSIGEKAKEAIETGWETHESCPQVFDEKDEKIRELEKQLAVFKEQQAFERQG